MVDDIPLSNLSAKAAIKAAATSYGVTYEQTMERIWRNHHTEGEERILARVAAVYALKTVCRPEPTLIEIAPFFERAAPAISTYWRWARALEKLQDKHFSRASSAARVAIFSVETSPEIWQGDGI